MNILYINHYAGGPAYGMAYRPYYLAREWARAGHTVRILAASYSHVRAVQPTDHGSRITKLTTEWIDGIEYVWYPTPVYAGNGVGRVKNIWAFLRQVWAGASQTAKEFRPDVVIASSTYPMDIWVARRIARMAGARLVFEVHDLWPLSPIELGGMSPWHPFIMLCQAAEDAAYRDAHLVVSMLPKVHQHMASRKLDLKKLVIVPNGIDADEWNVKPQALREDVAQALSRARVTGRKIIGYAGSHGLPNALDNFLDAATLLRDEPLQIVMLGDGHEKARLVRRVADEGLTNVTMLPPIPKAQIPSFLESIDIAYIGWRREPIYRFGIAPNKLMDYMMAGCAVLHAVEAGNDPVAEAGCGVTIEPENPEALATAIRYMAALAPAERERMGRAGRAYVEQQHLYSVLARRFLDAVQECAA